MAHGVNEMDMIGEHACGPSPALFNVGLKVAVAAERPARCGGETHCASASLHQPHGASVPSPRRATPSEPVFDAPPSRNAESLREAGQRPPGGGGSGEPEGSGLPRTRRA